MPLYGWALDLRYIKGYKPYSCNGFCPYSDTCTHGTNILSTVKVRRHHIERLPNYVETYVPIEEAEEDFKQKLIHAMDADRNGWYVIKAQTALGKTQSYLEQLRNTSLNVLIAVPTLILKNQICQRAKRMGIKMRESPSLREFSFPDDVQSEIENCYSRGRSPIPYLKKAIKEGHPCSGLFKKYLYDIEAFGDYGGHGITTHKMLLTLDVSKYDLVIVDEDIIFKTVVPNKVDISISDLKKLRKKIEPSGPLARKINQVLKHAKSAEYFSLPKIGCDWDEYDDIKMAVDIPSLCSATHFCYRKVSDDLPEACVSFLKPVEFKEVTKYIMVSATADEEICRYYFGDNLTEFHECKRAANQGNLNQYYSRSMSRADIAKDPAIIDRIKKWSGFEHTISFKKYRRGGLYFGNTEGCDHLKGENIDVIGTPHQPEWIYKLFAFSLECGIDIDERIKPGTAAVHNGYRFRFTTYEGEGLRAIQFWMIESEQEQAVGRARLLRKGCTVNLFSNFPLRQANLMESEYDKEADRDV